MFWAVGMGVSLRVTLTPGWESHSANWLSRPGLEPAGSQAIRAVDRLEVEPDALADSGADRDIGSRRQMWPGGWGVWIIAAILCILVVASALFLHGKRVVQNGGDLTAAGSSGVVPQSLRLKGMTEAIEKRAIQTPLLAGEKFGTLTIVKLTPAGTVVKRGDFLVEFDRQAQLRDFLDKQATASDLTNKVAAAQQNEEAARAKDETEMKVAEDNLGKAELEIEKVEILSRIDSEKAQENLDEAKATLAQLKQTFDLKRTAAQASIRILQIQLERNQETMEHAQANAALLEVRSPLDGIVVLNTIWKQGSMGEVQEGDQVRSGVAFMQVVDPSRMEVQVPVNQEDLLGLKIGQSALVHLDAYPGLTFPGKLENIGPMGRSGDFSNRIRTFSAVFSIEGHDPRLMPDLSAAVDVQPVRDNTPAGGTVR
jgi:HlyD family secretion protein